MSRAKITILGGDYRYKLLKELLEEDGYRVSIYGNSYCESCDNLDSGLYSSTAVIAPIPISKDESTINMTENFPIIIDELFNKMENHNIQKLIAGVISDNITIKAREHGIKTVDLFSLDEVAVKNAIPTAEGAIMTAIQESQDTLFGSNVLVTGYGKCGKILSHMLRGIGANVSVTYRKKSDEAYIIAESMTPVNIKEMNSRLQNYDYIFNTVPSKIFNKEALKRISINCVIIDIASAPGGVDYSYAKKLNLKAIYCPSLPGRVAPRQAAKILKDCISDIMLEN